MDASRRLGLSLWRVPSRAPFSSVSEQPAKDAALLKGDAPSPEEWQDGWASLSEKLPLRKAARIDGRRRSACAPECNRTRKRYRRQLVVMEEVLRRKVRRVLWQATSMSLGLDESKYSKIVRFRADLPSASSARLGPGSQWRHVGASGFSQSGVLGVLDCSKKHAT